ncbi:hypothetical protein [Nonomuraea aurantiaca]|jgi:hypothetical protein|uniref:hypothetical protein n=1 Tax=Nonomuraea aurantiaca TaxID=2878562 RepID=UPI001CD93DED|nr:hypothetical protein [Nonomuraea aurantiaca]MCA2219910.1 hypothetical protein [Nonomuraea aurantiaca]
MIKMLHKMGIRSSHMYMAGVASIGASITSWLMSRNLEKASLARADRWGIFVGQWAPTFIALGVALRIEETHMEIDEEAKVEMFDRASGGVRQRTHAGT